MHTLYIICKIMIDMHKWCIVKKYKTRNLLGSLTGKKVVLLGELEKETGTAWSGYSAIVVFVPEWSKQTTFKFNDNFTSSNDTNKGKQYVLFVFMLYSNILLLAMQLPWYSIQKW